MRREFAGGVHISNSGLADLLPAAYFVLTGVAILAALVLAVVIIGQLWSGRD